METTAADKKPVTEGAESMPADRAHRDDLAMVTSADICDQFKIGRRTLQKWRKDGKFPEPDLVIGTTVRWLVTTVEDWVEDNRKKRGVRRSRRRG